MVCRAGTFRPCVPGKFFLEKRWVEAGVCSYITNGRATPISAASSVFATPELPIPVLQAEGAIPNRSLFESIVPCLG